MCALLTILLLLPFPTHAHDRDGGLGDRPERGCNPSRVSSCEAEHCPAARDDLAQAERLIDELHVLDARRVAAGASEHLHALEAAQADQELALLSSERKFLAHGAGGTTAAPLLSGFPSLQDYFPRHALEKSWHERLPSERDAKLSERVSEAAKNRAQLAAKQAQISGEIRTLNDQYQSKAGQRAHLLSAGQEHAVMCRNGCRDTFCP